MSFYRTLLAFVAAAVIATPVFADDDAATTATDQTTATTQTADAGTTTAAADAKVDLNKATAKELMKVKGLNASKARAIVAYRKKHGDFKSVEELAKVKGFTKMKPDAMQKITDQISVD